jgi:hypothetical protein
MGPELQQDQRILFQLEKALRRVWDLPFDFRSDFLPVLTGCAPIHDEIARRASNFIIDAVSSDSSVVRFMANHAFEFC